MDRQTLALLIPILALSIPVMAILFSGLSKLARVKREAIEAQYGMNPALEAQLEEIREEMRTLQHNLADTQERLDFTERMLAQQRDRQLPGSS